METFVHIFYFKFIRASFSFDLRDISYFADFMVEFAVEKKENLCETLNIYQ